MSNLQDDKIIELLEDIARWSRLQGMEKLRAVITTNLKTQSELLVYELSDGERSTRDIETVSRIGESTVGNYWQRRQRLGIVEKSRKFEGRWKRLCSLEDLGIEVPKLVTASSIPSTSQPATLDKVTTDA